MRKKRRGYSLAFSFFIEGPEIGPDCLGQGFGLGVSVRIDAGRAPHPGSVGDFSWAGLSGTYFWVDPAERLVAVLMLQAPAVRIYYRSLLRQLVYQALN